MANSKRTLWPFIVPLALGLVSALVFLVVYLNRDKAELTLRNKTGMAVLGGEADISSLGRPQEFGGLKNNDSAVCEFKSFGDGAYVVTVRFADGTSLTDSLGTLASGEIRKDEIVLGKKDDALGMTLIPGGK